MAVKGMPVGLFELCWKEGREQQLLNCWLWAKPSRVCQEAASRRERNRRTVVKAKLQPSQFKSTPAVLQPAVDLTHLGIG